MVAGGLSGSGISDLTKKQSEMSRSYSPAANNQINLSGKEGVVAEPDYQEAQQQASGGKENRAAQAKTAGAAAGISQVAGLQQNLGIFNQSLMAQVNTFLNGQSTSTVNAGLTSGGAPVFNKATNMWEAPDAKVGVDVSGLQAEKTGQQQDLQATAGELFKDGKATSFEEILKRFGDKNGDGVIDAEEQKWLNEAFDIVNGLRRLQETDPNAPEYDALMAQLAAKDKNGIVAGMLGALEQYEKIVGMKATGADADAYYLRDILNMGQDEIRGELEKAVTQSSGLFGADYEAYIKEETDKSARQYTESSREDATIMKRVSEDSTKWMQDFQRQFETGRNQLNSIFQGSAGQLIADLDRAARETGNKGIQQAKEWFVDTQTLVQQGGKDFATVIFQALVDSPLGAEPKKILKKWLGQTIGQDTVEKGVLANLMEKISSTGYFWTENSAGQQVQVAFNAKQKMELVRLMNDPNMDDATKTANIQKAIDSASQGLGDKLNQDLGKVLNPIKSGQLEQSLDIWEGAMSKSMQDFNGSLVQAGYGAAVSSMGRQNAPQAMQAAIEVHAKAKLDEINTAYETTKAAITEKQRTINADAIALQANVQKASELNSMGVTSVRQNLSTAFTDYSTKAMVKGIPVDVGQPAPVMMSALEVAYRNAALAYGFSLSKNTIKTPTGYKMATDVRMPSDINSEKYARVYSAVQMVKNLYSMKDSYPQWNILVRDFFGGKAPSEMFDLVGAGGAALIFAPNKNYIAAADKFAQALTNPRFADAVWKETPNYGALQDKVSKNEAALAEAQGKINEAGRSLTRLEESMNSARSTLGMQVQQAQDRLAPLAADISRQTANNMFNQALQGQSMQFTDMPQVDLEAMRASGNIQYVPHAQGYDPSGLQQYVTPKFTPAGAEIATGRPLADVTAPPPSGAAKFTPTTAPAKVPPPAGAAKFEPRIDKTRVKPEIVQAVKNDPSKTIGIEADGSLSVVPQGAANSVGEGYYNSIMNGGITDNTGAIVPTDKVGQPLKPVSPYRGPQASTPDGKPVSSQESTTIEQAKANEALLAERVKQAEEKVKQAYEALKNELAASMLPDMVIKTKHSGEISKAEKELADAKLAAGDAGQAVRDKISAEYNAPTSVPAAPTPAPAEETPVNNKSSKNGTTDGESTKGWKPKEPKPDQNKSERPVGQFDKEL